MLRPDATRSHADVVERRAVGDGSDVHGVGVAMGEHLHPPVITLDVEVPVAVLAHGSGPHPAPDRARHLGLEPLALRLRSGSHLANRPRVRRGDEDRLQRLGVALPCRAGHVGDRLRVDGAAIGAEAVGSGGDGAARPALVCADETGADDVAGEGGGVHVGTIPLTTQCVNTEWIGTQLLAAITAERAA